MRARHFGTAYEKVEEDGRGFKWITLRSGRKVSWFNAKDEVDRGMTPVVRWMSRLFKLAPNEEWAWDDIDRTVYYWETLAAAYREEIDKHVKHKTKEQRIAQLREVAGREPEEAALYLAKADQLEKEMNG